MKYTLWWNTNRDETKIVMKQKCDETQMPMKYKLWWNTGSYLTQIVMKHKLLCNTISDEIIFFQPYMFSPKKLFLQNNIFQKTK